MSDSLSLSDDDTARFECVTLALQDYATLIERFPAWPHDMTTHADHVTYRMRATRLQFAREALQELHARIASLPHPEDTRMRHG